VVKKYVIQYIRIFSQDKDSSVLVGPWVEHILLKLLELSVGDILLSVHSSCTTSEHLRGLQHIPGITDHIAMDVFFAVLMETL
jgi:hypothetical protein